MKLGPSVTANPEHLHIFYVQSYLSLAVCRAIIKRRQINSSQVRFILGRGLTPVVGFHTANAPERLSQGLRDGFRSVINNREIKRTNEKFLVDLSESKPFEFYVNRMNYLFLKIVRSIPQFQALNIYEEGLAAYYRRFNDRSLHGGPSLAKQFRRIALARLSGYKGRADAFFYETNYSLAFASDPRAFQDFPRRVSIDLVAEFHADSANQHFEALPKNAVLVVLPLANALRENDTFAEGFVRCIASVIKHVNGRRPIRFQPHPDQHHDARFWKEIHLRIRELCEMDIGEFCVEGMPLEAIAARRRDVSFCVIVSSTAVYAFALGREVLSIAPAVFGNQHPLVQQFRSICPDIAYADTESNLPVNVFNQFNDGNV